MCPDIGYTDRSHSYDTLDSMTLVYYTRAETSTRKRKHYVIQLWSSSPWQIFVTVAYSAISLGWIHHPSELIHLINTCLSNCAHHHWYSCFSRQWSIQTMIQKLQLLKPQLLQTDVEGSKQFSSCHCTFNTLIPTYVHLSFGKLLVANNRIEIRTSHILILLLLNTTTKTLGSDFLPWGIDT